MKMSSCVFYRVLSAMALAGCDHGGSKADAPAPVPSESRPTAGPSADSAACFDKKLEARKREGAVSALDLTRLYGVCAPNATSADFATQMEKYNVTFAGGIRSLGAKKKP